MKIKRHLYVQHNEESVALKKARMLRDLSVRDVGDLMGISHVRIHQMESGRGNITEEFVEQFLRAVDLSFDDWRVLLEDKSDQTDLLRQLCVERLDRLDQWQLKEAYKFISNLPCAE